MGKTSERGLDVDCRLDKIFVGDDVATTTPDVHVFVFPVHDSGNKSTCCLASETNILWGVLVEVLLSVNPDRPQL